MFWWRHRWDFFFGGLLVVGAAVVWMIVSLTSRGIWPYEFLQSTTRLNQAQLREIERRRNAPGESVIGAFECQISEDHIYDLASHELSPKVDSLLQYTNHYVVDWKLHRTIMIAPGRVSKALEGTPYQSWFWGGFRTDNDPNWTSVVILQQAPPPKSKLRSVLGLP